ncbi:hypothetical protein L596_016048 [Steinernema carpocapsae]|uniref:Serine/threonine-protein phosphatase n=1 Tax=Steinernema carpocapsae TaxID=34508 RepID=A0A4U5NHM8_STECR|nr:hypothetical protein L596_016048 [Steinernema carpocapsae]
MATGDARTERQIETCVSRLAETRLAVRPRPFAKIAKMMSGRSTAPFEVDAFLAKHREFSGKVSYEIEELQALIGHVRMVMAKEKALIEVPIPVNIVGDIHGQYADLHRIFSACGMPGKSRFLFLGDYVDRGPQSLECICCLLAFKIAYPDRVFLLRGNHEQEFINREYGFWNELEMRFPLGLAMQTFKEFNDLFGYFPIAALVRKRILCMHGGLSPSLRSLDDIRNIELPQVLVPDGTLQQDLLWSDPSPDLRGFGPNKLREVSVCFGPDVVYKTCQWLKLDMVVRGHQVMANVTATASSPTASSSQSFRRQCTTRFCGFQRNSGAVMAISAKMSIRFVLLHPVATANEAGPTAFQAKFKDDGSGYCVQEQAQ